MTMDFHTPPTISPRGLPYLIMYQSLNRAERTQKLIGIIFHSSTECAIHHKSSMIATPRTIHQTMLPRRLTYQRIETDKGELNKLIP